MSWLLKIWCRFFHQDTWVPTESNDVYDGGRRYWCHLCRKERTL